MLYQSFLNLVDTRFNSKIKSFRSDNATELAFNELFDEKGILHQYSCVGTPQQNSVVERKHQHLLNVAPALYFQSRIPRFWSECVLTPFSWLTEPLPLFLAIELLMSFFIRVLQITPLSWFLVVLLLLQHYLLRTRFDPRARICIFVGYSTVMKGYNFMTSKLDNFLFLVMLCSTKLSFLFTPLLLLNNWQILSLSLAFTVALWYTRSQATTVYPSTSNTFSSTT